MFAESDLVHKIQVGYAREDIIAGLCRAVATNYLNNVGKGKQIAAPVVFQGGVSKNAGVVQAFRDELGVDVVVDEDGHLMGAFGVALLAAEAAPRAGEPGGGEAFDFDALRTFEFVTREVECQKCANHCEIICVYRDGKIIDSLGQPLRQRRRQGRVSVALALAALEAGVQRHAAVDEQGGAGHVAGLVGREPGRGGGHVFGGRPRTPSGMSRSVAARASRSANFSALMGVFMAPGAMAFTRMPRSAYSSASVFVSMPTPALLAA